jgi:gas vesicle protein
MLIDWLLGTLAGPEWNTNKEKILNCIDNIIKLAGNIEGYLQRIFQPNGEKPNEEVILENIRRLANQMEEYKNTIQNLIQSESSTKKLSSVKRSLIERLRNTQNDLYFSILNLKAYAEMIDIFSEADRQELVNYVNQIKNLANVLKEIIEQIK